MDTEKYIGESQVIGQPGKKLNLKIAKGAITEEKIAEGAVTAGKLADNAVSFNNLSKDVQDAFAQSAPGAPVVDELGDSTRVGITQRKITEVFGTKQDLLVSGVSIKTINGSSLLGYGDVEIEGITIDDTPTEGSINAVSSGGVYDALQDIDVTSQISGKADKVSNATNNNFAALDSNGNLKDSGSKASDFATAAQGSLAASAIQMPTGGTAGQVLKKTSNGVAWDDASGGIANETDPVFTASPAYGITTSDITAWDAKQDALVSGTNIKTVGGVSLLGSGDIPTIKGDKGDKGDTVIIGGEDEYTLYNGLGNNTDGAMTQAAVTHYLSFVEDIKRVVEDGIFFIDSNDNIGAYINQAGIHAINLLESEVVSNG